MDRSGAGLPTVMTIPAGQPCAFLKGGSCTIYKERPTQCRDYPDKWGDLDLLKEKERCPAIKRLSLDEDTQI
jgi:Fe-S-cluster containining protein